MGAAGALQGDLDLAPAALTDEAFLGAPFPVPPCDEQAEIVRFLHYVDRRIGLYIRAKQRLVQLLEEQKQAVIHHGVTRGLEPKARLKPSGIDWLGDTPQHWDILPLRRRWEVIDCKHLTVPFVEAGVALASVRETQSFVLQLNEAKRTTEQWYRLLVSGDRAPRRGDLIYCRNVSVGAAALVDSDEQFAMGQDVCLIRSTTQSQRFLNYFLHSVAMASQLTQLLVGSTFDRINVADVKGLTVVVPPKVEQDAIAARLDSLLGYYARATDNMTREIALVREYRARLIADVITGKVDVRAVAERLPIEEVDAKSVGLTADQGGLDASVTDSDEGESPVEDVEA